MENRTFDKREPMKEDNHQIMFVRWLRTHYPELTVFHVPNGQQRDIVVAKRLKDMGVLSGVYDLYIMDYHLFIEMKSNGGSLSAAQRKFRDVCAATNHGHFVANGFTDAIEKFKTFIME